MSALVYTRFDTSGALTKRFTLGEHGALKKSAAVHLAQGQATRCAARDLDEFDSALAALPSSAALTYGVAPGFPAARIVAQKYHRDGDGTITRTRRYFQFAPGPGIFMQDHDPLQDADPLEPHALIDALVNAAPVLAEVPMLWRPSVSSGIRTTDGRPLTGLKGQRVYLPVQDATLIPKAGEALVNLLWAAGHGYIVIGAAGQMLPRTLVDATVWQPERLDFAAPPILGPGLGRDPPPSRIIGDASARLDLHRLIAASDGTIQAAATKARQGAIAAVRYQAQAAQDAWTQEHAAALAEVRGISVEQAKHTLQAAAGKHLLTGDYLLHTDTGQQVTVGELLDAPERWHGRRFADPLEPDYGDDARIAWANLRSGGRPYLHSHAHGRRRFYLVRPPARIRLCTGERARVTDHLLDLLHTRQELYELGEGAVLARITEDARALPVTRDWLLDHFERVAQFYVVKMTDEEPQEVPKDAPAWAAAAILAKDGERRMPRLDAVISAPTLRRDGSILAEPGYDAVSRLLLRVDSPESAGIPSAPTLDHARAALAHLWAPFAEFPLVDAVDRGVVLAGILTALVRASLPTAPGFGFDAPAAGSGKTLLAQSIGAFTTGQEPAALPPANNQDEEVRKRLFATLRDGYRVLPRIHHLFCAQCAPAIIIAVF